VFRPAIVAASSAVALAHNHPSGDPTPSEADIRVTRDFVRAGQLLKIELPQHQASERSGPNASTSLGLGLESNQTSSLNDI
jgi:DNA repair protein RadC